MVSKKIYEVGYGKPPRKSRFRKGQSGNPKGRPKGSLNFATVARKVLSKRVSMNLNGKQRSVPVYEAILIRQCLGGLEGKQRAVEQILKLAAEVMGAEPDHAVETLSNDDRKILEGFLERHGSLKSRRSLARIRMKRRKRGDE